MSMLLIQQWTCQNVHQYNICKQQQPEMHTCKSSRHISYWASHTKMRTWHKTKKKKKKKKKNWPIRHELAMIDDIAVRHVNNNTISVTGTDTESATQQSHGNRKDKVACT